MYIRWTVVPWILFLLTLSSLFSASVSAQVPDDGPTSIGFSAPDSTQPVRAYRLPTWHWSRWTLLGNGSADWTSDESAIRERTGYGAGLTLRPRYNGFWESEERRASLTVRPRVSLDRGGQSSDSTHGASQERKHYNYSLSLGADGVLREYISDQTFLLVEGRGALSYRRDHETMDSGTEAGIEISSDVRFTTRLGLGVGRVRVVTPVVRALRVRERLRAVAPGASLSDDQVQAAARQLARRPGYEAVYDRPDKAFWRDFFERVELGESTVFESFYVADVLREPVGVRREGAELVAGLRGRYTRHLNRTERAGRLLSRFPHSSNALGGFAEGRWYRNVSLRHQVGTDVEARFTNFIDMDPLAYEADVNAQGQWLWVLADRVRLDNRVYTNVSLQHDKSEDRFRIDRSHALSSDLRIFVENRLSFSVGATLSYSYREEFSGSSNSGIDTGIQFRINYVLSRSLR